MISKFPVHGTSCLATYNFLDSQRRDVILPGTNLEARADQTISKPFQNTSFTVTKMDVKIRKPTDCTTTFRRTIAPVDDITLRV